MQHRKGGVHRSRPCRLPGDQPARCPGRAAQQLLSHTDIRAHQSTLKQLANHPVGKIGLELRTSGPENFMAPRSRAPTGDFEKGRLADSCPALDNKHSALRHHHIRRRHLTIAFEQRHDDTLRRRGTDRTARAR